MRNWYRVRLGRDALYAPACLAGGFVGVDYGLTTDLAGQLPDDWRTFNRTFIPRVQAENPGKSKIAAGITCGAIWTLAKGINAGDVVVSPVGHKQWRAGTVTGEYWYAAGDVLPHRRSVEWFGPLLRSDDLTSSLRNVVNIPVSVCTLSPFSAELERLVGGTPEAVALPISATDDPPPVTDPWAFAMEKHLEEFLVDNWGHTELGQAFDIYEVDGERVGQQYPTATGPLDILAVSKDRRTLLVVELKKGRASDAVVGQTLRYMGYVQEELAEVGQTVEGAIIALEDDARLTWALKMVPAIRLYRYELDFKLVQGGP